MTKLWLSNTPPPAKNNRLVSKGYFERGRTLVEMLGMLAIMAVLSLVSIYAYQIAMNKHRANETIDRLQRRAVTVSSQSLTGSKSDLSFDENDGTYPIPNAVEYVDDNLFRLQVTDVPESVCHQIQSVGWTTGKMSPDDCSATTLKFTFRNDLSNCSDCPIETFDCTPYDNDCGTCTKAQGFNFDDSACTDAIKKYCVNGHCSRCPRGSFYSLDGNYCRNCQTGYQSDTATLAEEARNCLGTDFYANNRMYHCDNRSAIPSNVDEKSCTTCSERCFHSTNKSCQLVNKAYIRDGKGICKCTSTPNSVTHNGYCYYCEVGSFFSLDGNQCRACKTGYQTSTNTLLSEAHRCLEKDFYANGVMYHCDSRSTQPQKSDEESCIKCAERCFDADNNNTCRLMGTTYDKDENGHCVPKT